MRRPTRYGPFSIRKPSAAIFCRSPGRSGRNGSRAQRRDEFWICSGRSSFATDAAITFHVPDGFVDPFGSRTRLFYDSRYDLFIETIQDPQGNRSHIEQFDYRVLAATEISDINQNRTESVLRRPRSRRCDRAQGQGAGGRRPSGVRCAERQPVAARAGPVLRGRRYSDVQVRDWLGRASLRFVYDFGEDVDAAGVLRPGARPASACTFRRETHVAAPGGDTSAIQIALECSDGAGGTLMRKTLAESATPGGDPRWIVSGKTVLNNKGNAVKEYRSCTSPIASGRSRSMKWA